MIHEVHSIQILQMNGPKQMTQLLPQFICRMNLAMVGFLNLQRRATGLV